MHRDGLRATDGRRSFSFAESQAAYTRGGAAVTGAAGSGGFGDGRRELEFGTAIVAA